MTAPQNTSGFASTVRTDDGGDLRCANRLASQAKARWRQGEQPDVAAMLAEHPELSRCRSVALDLACEEYSRRLKAGEALDPERFSQRFPTLWRSLWLQIRTRGLLDKNPGVRADEEIVPGLRLGILSSASSWRRNLAAAVSAASSWLMSRPWETAKSR